MKKRGKNKSGQSGIITIVLILLLSLVAIVIVWNVVNGVLKRSSSQVNVDPFTIGLELKESKIYTTGQVEVKVNRKTGEGKIDSLKFIFYDKNGKTYVTNRSGNIQELETLTYIFNYTEINFTSPIDKIIVIPVIGNKFGLEFQESDARKDEKGERIISNPAGLVSYWKFNGDMRDSAGINHGSCINCPTLANDKKGNLNSVYSFDGVDDSINIGNTIDDLLIGNGPISVSAWVIYNGGQDASQNLAEIISIGFGSTYGISLASSYNGNNRPGFVYRTSGITNGWAYNSGAALNDGLWHHIVVVATAPDNTNNFAFYIDNIKVSFSSSYAHVSLDNSIGNGIYGYFKGSVDNVMIFNRSLSPDEINGLYNNQK